MTDEVQRDLGRFEAQIGALGEKFDDLANVVSKQGDTLSEINQTLSRAKGGLGMLVLLAGVGGSILGFLIDKLMLFIRA